MHDDERRRRYAHLLEDADHEVAPRPALAEPEALEPSAHDLALIDHPESIELTREEIGPEVPIVALTDSAHPREIDEALDAGADAYIVCPFEPTDLVDELHLMLRAGLLL